MKTNRNLHNKAQRAALYQKYKGFCALCGTKLAPNWHADHVVPWKIKPETNLHLMQALCPTCNLKKGAKHETA